MSQPQESMEVEETQFDFTARNNEIEKIFKLRRIITNNISALELKRLWDTEGDKLHMSLDFCNDLSGFIFTVFSAMRKDANPNKPTNNYMKHSAELAGITLSVATVVSRAKEEGIEFDFKIATPLLNAFTAFKPFFTEVRIGVNRYSYRLNQTKAPVKRDSSGKEIPKKPELKPIGDYGLNNQHAALLQGISLPPERRTGLLKSMGPLSLMIFTHQEKHYKPKMEEALLRSISMLPFKNAITECMRNNDSPSSIAPMAKELGDLLDLTTARSTQKFYFPFLVYEYIWENTPLDKRNWFSTSGHKMMALFGLFAQRFLFKMRGVPGTESHLSQAVFHAMFGTYLDDISILSTVTNHAIWNKRSEMDKAFKRTGVTTIVEFKPVRPIYFSKMAQALLTKSGGNMEPMYVGRPAFSGKRTRHFTAEFKEYLETGKAATAYGSNPSTLAMAIKEDRLEWIKKHTLDDDTIGTTDWYEWKGDELVVSKVNVVESGKYFY